MIFRSLKKKSFAVSKVEDLRWSDMLDLYSCTGCGRCQELCPTIFKSSTFITESSNFKHERTFIRKNMNMKIVNPNLTPQVL